MATRSARLSLSALVAVERAARVRLAASVRGVAASAGSPIAAAPARLLAASHAVERTVAADLLLVRRAARRESLRTLRAEMEARGVPLLALPSRPEEEDQAQAAAGAKGYAAGWLASALTEREGGEAGDLAGRLDVLATSQTAGAFGAERDEEGEAYAREAERRGLPIPLKQWLSDLDRVTCPRCAALDGTLRPWGLGFPGDAVPGLVHRSCRCIETVAVFPAVWREGGAAAEAEEDEAA